jgi:O-6-methylguanine DNA methyltransferase
MKEQIQTVILPALPIVGSLRLSSFDGKTLAKIDVVKEKESGELCAFFKECYFELNAYLSGEARQINLPVDLSGIGPFQANVLSVMKRIPFGKTISYGELARELNTKAFQAIGTACGKNPLMLVYPCHRVVGASNLGGFAHGLSMKKQLLKLEGVGISNKFVGE